MKTRYLGLAVVMVALAVLVNVMALSSATVNSDFTANVVNSSTALIALGTAGATQDPDVLVTETAGIMTLTFADGIQPQSTYTFASAFKITNNSANNVTLNVTATGAPAGMTVTMTDLSNVALGPIFALAAGASVEVKLVIASDDTVTTGNKAISIDVVATKAA